MALRKTQSFKKVGMVSTESVLKCTGKDWNQWVQLLTKVGALHWEHKQIVAFLKGKFKLGPWWEQGVATGFEMAIGKKIPGYSKTNGFSMTATRTIKISAPELWKILFSQQGLEIWLSPLSEFQAKPGQSFESSLGAFGEIRTIKKNRRLRMTWTEEEWDRPSVLQVTLVPRPKEKSILVIQHEKIPNGRVRDQMRTHWKQVLGRLNEVIDI